MSAYRVKTFLALVLILPIAVCVSNTIILWPGENLSLAGKDNYLEGEVTVAWPNNLLTEIHTRSSLIAGNNIATWTSEAMHISMVDCADVAIQPNTLIPIDRYPMHGDEKNYIVFSLLRGTLRAITGWIENLNARDDKTTTLDVTIGIRA